MAHVLLVEDDDAIRTALTRGLGALGHVVTSAPDGATGIATLTSSSPDVVVLDLGLPDVDGSTVLAVNQTLGARAPVIVATARDDEREIIRLLDAGADDYVVKPFSAAQIDARIRAVLRRAGAADVGERALVVGGLVLDPAARTVEVDGQPVELTRKEFDLLQLLMQHPGEVLSKPRILAEVWQQP